MRLKWRVCSSRCGPEFGDRTLLRRGCIRPRQGNAGRRSGATSDQRGHFHDNMDILTLEHFAARLNETFVASGDGNASFVLVEVRPLAAPTLQGMLRAPFSLLFRNCAPIMFTQKIYRMQHASLGEVGIFLVPVARDREGFLYQAVFN